MTWKTAADSKSKMMTTIRRSHLLPIWAGLLLASSPALARSTMDYVDGHVSIVVDLDRVTVHAENARLSDVVEQLAAEFDLRLVLHADLGHSVSVRVTEKILPDAIADILANHSYQLFVGAPGEGDAGDEVPGTLWVFSEGSSLAPASTVFLEAVLFHGSFREKKEAIRELGRLATPAAVQALSLALSDGNAEIRGSAFEALETMGSDDAIAAISSAALDADPWVRAEAVTALASGDSDSAAQYLSLSLDDPDPRVRMAVIEALADVPFGSVPSEQAVAALNRALSDEDPDVRMQALDSIEELGGEVAYEALMRAKRDQDARIADAAKRSLSSLSPDKQM